MPLRGNSTSAAPQRWKRKALGHQTARRALFAYDTGVPARDLGRSNQSQRWAKAPVLAISISLASGLRRKLAHSDARPLSTKTALRGFHRGPDLAETFGPSARDGLLSCVGGCRTDLTCFFPPLPLCRPRIGIPATTQAALSEAGSAEREGRPFDDHPRKQHPRPQLRGNTLSVPKDPGAPGRSLPNYGGTDSLDPRFAQT